MEKLRERLKPLPLKGKIEYIFEYYSFHMIAVVVILFFLIMGVQTFTNQPKEILSVRIIGSHMHVEKTEGLEQEIERLLLDNNGSQKEELSVISIDTSDVEGNPDTLLKIQKLSAEIAAKEVDVLLVDEVTFHQFNQEGNLLNLSNISTIKDWNVTKYPSQLDSAKITGINVADVSYFTPIVGNDEPLVFAVLANTERMDEVKKFMEALH